MKMNASALKIASIGVNVFDRLGLEDSIPNYQIINLKDDFWITFFPQLKEKVILLSQLDPTWRNIPGRIQTEKALNSVDWSRIKQTLGIKNLLTIKPVPGQEEFFQKNGIKILNNSFDLANRLENKAECRVLMGRTMPFPKYEILPFPSLRSVSYQTVRSTYGDFVIQDDTLSGGKGTFFIRSEADFHQAVTYLSMIPSQQVVVSEFIVGRSASVQVCVTKYGVFCLPAQRQVINQAALTNTTAAGADKFNGGQWSPEDFSEPEKKTIQENAQRVGVVAQQLGYKGILGVDLMTTSTGQVYVIEVNARLTGMTSVIVNIQKSLGQIPFLLLHTLEHLGVEYSLTEKEVEEIRHYSFGSKSYGYLILYNLSTEKLRIGNTLKPGIYRNGQWQQYSYTVGDLQDLQGALLLDFPQKGELVNPNARVGRVIVPRKILDQHDQLTPDTNEFIHQIRSML